MADLRLNDPTPGRIVIYKLPNGPRAGEERPALVVRSAPLGLSIQVFTDGKDDGFRDPSGMGQAPLTFLVQNAEQGEEKGQWRWPTRA